MRNFRVPQAHQAVDRGCAWRIAPPHRIVDTPLPRVTNELGIESLQPVPLFF
jgi:hypothetical protein